jgi:hypothetical protein
MGRTLSFHLLLFLDPSDFGPAVPLIRSACCDCCFIMPNLDNHPSFLGQTPRNVTRTIISLFSLSAAAHLPYAETTKKFVIIVRQD